MKKFLQFIVLIVCCVGYLNAQTPMFFNTNGASGANVFPLGSASTGNSKVQWCIPAGSLGTVTAGNNITKVWFQSGGAYTNTYPILNVRLKTGTTAGLTGVASGAWEPGMTLVYSGTAVVLTTTSGQWFGFTLTTPWLYNPALPLFVEVEQNASSANQTVYQAVNISGSGNGRQWGLYGSTTIVGTGLNQVNFGIDVLPATPCTAPPAMSSVVPFSYSTCPGITNPTIGIAATYTDGGITYQWLASTTSSVGPWSPITGSLATIQAPTLGVTTWFQAVATCTNPGGGSTSLTPNQFFVAGTTSNTVPYNEGFEGIQGPNRLPNCSWLANNMGAGFGTYTSSSTSNRVPRNGSNFAAFSAPTSLTNNAIYSNGIWCDPGITYSATVWYQTDLTGANNWSNLSMSIGSNQNSSSQTLVASTNGPAISFLYKPLTNTFTVASSGLYFVEIKAVANSGGAPYLMIDDLSVTIPCSINSPNLNATANATTICQGNPVIINASGANTYSWSTGATTSSISNSPLSSTQYFVIGTSSLTGCASTVNINVNVNPSPFVLAMPVSPFVCLGSVGTLLASGATNYAWSNGSSGSVAYVTPTANTTYTVIGTNTNNCSGTALVSLNVLSLPIVNTAISSNSVCTGEKIDLVATGANSYQWITNANSQLYIGSQISVILNNAGSFNFTVTGKDANGCTTDKSIAVTVNPCVGINETTLNSEQLSIYPNPANEILHIDLKTTKIELINILDIYGRLVLSSKTDNNAASINISGLANGVYFVKVSSVNHIETIKFIKE